jgi:hypothetical protein
MNPTIPNRPYLYRWQCAALCAVSAALAAYFAIGATAAAYQAKSERAAAELTAWQSAGLTIQVANETAQSACQRADRIEHALMRYEVGKSGMPIEKQRALIAAQGWVK